MNVSAVEVLRLMAPVLRDVAATADVQIRAEVEQRPVERYSGGESEEPADTVWIWSADGSGSGIVVSDGLTEQEQVADVANRVHEHVVEARWFAGLSTSWPPCPWHPDSHPLGVELRDAEAVWVCPANGHASCAVGQLAR